MLSLAGADSSAALRNLLRYPLRIRLLYNNGIHSSLPGTHSMASRREKSSRGPIKEKQWVDRALKYRSTPKHGKEEESIDYSTQNGVLRVLAAEIRNWKDNSALGLKASQWGLRGDVLKAILTRSDPDHPQKDASPHSTGVALLNLWSQEALASLESASSSSTLPLDLENATHALAAEGIDCVPRLLMNSYLQWLESQLKQLPEGSRLLARTQSLRSLADMRQPTLAFTAARSIVRQIHLHVGPTNSGKTHGALMALCKANTGVYAGPLRLLAHEVWDRISSGTVSPGVAARPCNLITGEEVKMAEGLAGLSACTVEMINYSRLVDVAVIDEIQMIADPQRGSSWTAAVLGLAAKELHLCGENSVIPLIKKIAQACGDELHIHNYHRLTPLKLGESLGGDLNRIQKGDCVVAFSRSELFQLKQEIETLTPHKCALAYGALPPETKAEQARKFNDPDNDVSVMVASDAIGMGLNLKIKRVIFAKVTKWNGTEVVPISTSQLKQIAGRAGRYGTSKEDAAGGLATTLNDEDLPILESALEAPLQSITRGSIRASPEALESLATLIPNKKKREHIERGHSRDLMTLYTDVGLLSQIDSRIYFLGKHEQEIEVAPLLEEMVSTFRYMPIADRDLFATAPCNRRDEMIVSLLCNMVNYYARGGLVRFEDVDTQGMLRTLRSVEEVAKAFNAEIEGQDTTRDWSSRLGDFLHSSRRRFDINDLMVLESLHRGLTLYLWLSYRRFVSFCYRDSVTDYSRRTEKAIDFCLGAVKAARAIRMAERHGNMNQSRFSPQRKFNDQHYKQSRRDEPPHRDRFQRKDRFSGAPRTFVKKEHIEGQVRPHAPL